MTDPIIDAIKWDDAGLVPAIAQQYDTGRVLMVAWMNREALATTLEEGRAVYWSRSRRKLWRKGEESGHVQHLKELRTDCDSDVLLLQVDQAGGIACHTGRHSCFYKRQEGGRWQDVESVIRDPEEIYAQGSPGKSV